VATTNSTNKNSRKPARSAAPDIATKAQEHIHGLTARGVEGVTSVEPIESGWLVEVEVIEDRRVPSSSDMLALYEVELNDDGDLQAYRRTKRYARGRGELGLD
jgi:hypothetical protein